MSKKSDAIKALRAVAEGHYNKTLPERAKWSGLCWACGFIADRNGHSLNDVYAIVNRWCDPHTKGPGLYIAPCGKHWNQRAMFALLLAESKS